MSFALYKQLSRQLLVFLCLTLTPVAAFSAAKGPSSKSPVTIVAFGDSLTAGYQLDQGEGFAPQLQKALREKGYKVTIIDAGVSGDTSTGGLSRLDWVTSSNPDAIILELGANDALRGIDPKVTRANLETMIERLKARGINVLLAGMLAPPNMGSAFTKPFNAIYPELAKENGVLFYPFFLDGVAARKSLTLPDGMHPNAKGVELMVKNILPKVEELISAIRQKESSKAAP